MIPFIEQAQFYATYHQNATSRYIHMIGIPLIILSLMIVLGFVHVFIPGVLSVNLADIATFALLIYYFRLQWRLALVITPLFILLLWIAVLFSHAGPTAFALWSFLVIFIIGAALQLVGHFIEGKRPALTDNLWHVFIAPLFLVAEGFFMAGRMHVLNEEIHGKKYEKTH